MVTAAATASTRRLSSTAMNDYGPAERLKGFEVGLADSEPDVIDMR